MLFPLLLDKGTDPMEQSWTLTLIYSITRTRIIQNHPINSLIIRQQRKQNILEDIQPVLKSSQRYISMF